MKLTAGTTSWDKANPSVPHYPRLRHDLDCDVAVIGAGITGALVAHQLVQAGLRTVVVDKRIPGMGSTHASTALLLYETDTSLAELARRHGRSGAVRAYALGRRAIREIGRITRELGDNCGFSVRKCLYLASDAGGWVQLQEEGRRRRRAGFPCRLLTRAQLKRRFGLRFPGALYSPGSAQVDALHLARALLAHDRRAGGLRVFQGTRIRRVRTHGDGVRLEAGNHRVIRARFVVIAAGYETAPFLKPGLVDLHSSYVIASRPVPPEVLWKDRCVMWETARPYFYLRTTADHRILMGGEDEPFADPARRDARLAAKQRRLLGKFRELFPGIPFEVDCAWAGTFGESRDGLPYIGARPGEPRVLYALGYGGNGITFSQIAARLLRRICLGQPARDAHLFSFARTGTAADAPSRKHRD